MTRGGGGGGRGLLDRGHTNKPIPHSCFHLSLLLVEQIEERYIVIENRGGTTDRLDKGRQMRWKDKERDKIESKRTI